MWERCEKAFSSNAVEEDAVNVAAAHSDKIGGDARVAIDILLKAGRLAGGARRSGAPAERRGVS
ncbi:MAG: cell division control protein Cdc6, partial [Planctomycetes bacterium]|nr:cell division control protein Cdc6 [Planctomycetota bacterium]